ncbi:hypothetical protein N177_2220 [Lutibaculum baratangense AMV1]|uniref:Uncharacterized protein n=1 Tax=Lutibaculum baratangense AMV1 TaxID=631454 RepID=V4QYU8_9HYPH|nr:hypothetical protein N177_2220 [Lutibaculum baratangense AMV1]
MHSRGVLRVDQGAGSKAYPPIHRPSYVAFTRTSSWTPGS